MRSLALFYNFFVNNSNMHKKMGFQRQEIHGVV